MIGSRAIPPLAAIVGIALLLTAGVGSPTATTRAQGALQAQVASGAALYAEWCALCHGLDGEGGEGPALAAPREIAAFRTAGRLFDFISTSMPQDFPGLLTDPEYYDLVAFLLDWNGLNPDGLPVDATTAPDILLAN